MYAIESQINAYIDYESRAQAAEWAQEWRNEELQAYYPQCRAIAAALANEFAAGLGDYRNLSDAQPDWHDWLRDDAAATGNADIEQAMLLLINEEADFTGIDFVAASRKQAA